VRRTPTRSLQAPIWRFQLPLIDPRPVTHSRAQKQRRRRFIQIPSSSFSLKICVMRTPSPLRGHSFKCQGAEHLRIAATTYRSHPRQVAISPLSLRPRRTRPAKSMERRYCAIRPVNKPFNCPAPQPDHLPNPFSGVRADSGPPLNQVHAISVPASIQERHQCHRQLNILNLQTNPSLWRTIEKQG